MLSPLFTSVAEGATLHFSAQIQGRASRATWSFGDGTPPVNGGVVRNYNWMNPGDYTVTFTAYNLDNPNGVSTNVLIHVLARVPPTLTFGVTGGVFTVSCPTIPGLFYVAQQATNLAPPITWQTIGQTYSVGNPFQFTDPNATNGARFFRVYMH
jgi:hypothetical protein